MRKLSVFESISVDGFFTDAEGDMSWAKPAERDPELDAFSKDSSTRGGTLIFGRVTYEMMAGFWTSDMAKQMMPEVAGGMNASPKIVFSKTLASADWAGTRLVKTDPVAEIRRLKQESGPDMCILGSGSIVSQLSAAGLIDAYQFVVVPVVIGKGRSLFETVRDPFPIKLESSRAFPSGRVLLTYSKEVPGGKQPG
ncbi:MAG: dihydrofolate reductase [Bdellovibrionales bacterium]|nr:dihydrofolate reductase [Bdellovibrionales bacterium]